MEFKIISKNKTSYNITLLLYDKEIVSAFKKASKDAGEKKTTLVRKMVEHCLKEAGYLK